MHAFHLFAVKDRVDFFKCSETTTSATVNVEKLLISSEDIKLFESDIVVLLSRFLLHVLMFC